MTTSELLTNIINSRNSIRTALINKHYLESDSTTLLSQLAEICNTIYDKNIVDEIFTNKSATYVKRTTGEIEKYDIVGELTSSSISNISTVSDIIIGNNVTSIGEEAFAGCSSLTAVTIPSSVTSIEARAFGNCEYLPSVTIPDGVTSIGAAAFTGCSHLTSVTIPSTVTSIGDFAFDPCFILTSITFNGNPPASVGTDAFNTANENTIGYYLSSNSAAWEAVIVDGKWNGMTMEEFVPLETIVTYSDGSTSSFLIEGEIVGSMYNMSSKPTNQITNVKNATEIKLGKAVTSLGADAFVDCTSLTSITIPEGVTSIKERVFMNCSTLTSVTIPSSVTYIERYSFGYCTSLSSITIPENITRLGDYVFRDCSSLTSIIFAGNPPTGLIDPDAFTKSNENLVGYYLPENATKWTAIITNGKWNGITMQQLNI